MIKISVKKEKEGKGANFTIVKHDMLHTDIAWDIVLLAYSILHRYKRVYIFFVMPYYMLVDLQIE